MNRAAPRQPSVGTRSISTGLVERLRLGDDAAWQRLLELYVPTVFSWCRHSGVPAHDSADIVQEVFTAVMRGIPSFRHGHSGDTFRGWLRTIARNKISDYFRAQAGRPRAPGGTGGQQWFMDLPAEQSKSSPDAALLSDALRRALDLIRVEFEDSTWQAFWATTVGQLPARQVADRLAMTPHSVRQAKYRVLRRLRQELGEAE